MARVLVDAAIVGFEWDGKELAQYLSEEDRADQARQLRAALEYLAERPDPLAVSSMAKTPEQEKRIRAAWRKLVLGLVSTDKQHDV